MRFLLNAPLICALAFTGLAPHAAFADADAETEAPAPEPPETDGRQCDGDAPVIRVTVEGVAEATGQIVADLHDDDPDNFLKSGRHVARVRTAAMEDATTLCIPAPSTGVFAIGVYHDENGNKEFDKGALGIPVEPYGVSNNPKMRFGPPKFKKAKFDVDETGAELVIRLKG